MILRLARAGVILSLVAILGPSSRPSAAAQPAARILQLVDQTPFVEPEGELTVRLRATGAPPDAKLRVVVHDRVLSRSEFARSVTGDGLRTRLLTNTQPLTALTADASGTLVVRVPIRSTGPDTSRLRIRGGVFPVELDLLDSGGAPVDQLVTYLVRLPDTADVSPPLSVALVVPLAGAPALQADGTTILEERARASLGVEVAALLNHPGLPLTVVPTPEIVDALAEGTDAADEALLANLREGLTERQLLATPYVHVDATALVDAGLDDLLADEILRGRNVLTDQVGAPDATKWVADPGLDNDTVVELGRLGVTAVVIPADSLAPLDEGRFPVTLTQSFDMDANGARMHAAAADAALAAHIGESGDPVLDAHVLLADLATLYYDSPRLTRGAVVAIPRDWTPDPDFLDALLTGLAPNRAIQPVDLATFFATVPTAGARGPNSSTEAPADPLFRSLVAAAPAGLDNFPAALAAAQRDVATYRSMIGPDSPRADPLDERLLVSASSDLSADERRGYLDAVGAAIDAEVAKVETARRQTITLTAREGRVPLLIRNRAGYPLRVVIHFESERLAFPSNPDGTMALTLTEEVTRVEVDVRARASGDTPLDVAVTSPDGRRTLSRARYRIRSTAVSGLGIVLSVGAGGFLLFWWAGNARRARRRRRAAAMPAG